MKSLACVLPILALVSAVHAQTLSGDALVKALRQGGFVILMRHASSPRDTPDKQTANPDNVTFERQLDEAGWLQKKVTELPAGNNTIIVSHFPNINRAFPQWFIGPGGW